MSRLPGPDEGWIESTEGDLDPDLAEETGHRLEDWERPYSMPLWLRLGVAFMLAVFLLSLVAWLIT